MKIRFTKMHGCGNDFVVINATDKKLQNWQPTREVASIMLNRRFGIGGDQLLVIYNSQIADLKMTIFNPDGSEVEMCGNGIRCCALYANKYIMPGKSEFKIETLAGIIKPVIEKELVRVNMGIPKFDANEIPVEGYNGQVINVNPPEIDDDYKLPEMTCVSMGNPHAVFFVDDVNSVPIERIGKKVENAKVFPNRTNVEFIQVLNVKAIKMRVWERGAGITLACGTGACAAAVSAILLEKTEKNVEVLLDGGNLYISWEGIGKPVFMTGPAVEVYNGEFVI